MPLPVTDRTPVTLTIPSRDWQGIFLCHGDNTVTRLDDDSPAPFALSDVQKRIAAARLRAWADRLDMPSETPCDH